MIGARGESLAKVMAEAPEAHKGISVPGFPNYFFAVGPNGLVLNVPYFVTVEQNVPAARSELRGPRYSRVQQPPRLPLFPHDQRGQFVAGR